MLCQSIMIQTCSSFEHHKMHFQKSTLPRARGNNISLFAPGVVVDLVVNSLAQTLNSQDFVQMKNCKKRTSDRLICMIQERAFVIEGNHYKAQSVQQSLCDCRARTAHSVLATCDRDAHVAQAVEHSVLQYCNTPWSARSSLSSSLSTKAFWKTVSRTRLRQLHASSGRIRGFRPETRASASPAVGRTALCKRKRCCYFG
jgi:hypothetical protein